GGRTAVDRDIGRRIPTSKASTAPSLPEISGGPTFSESVDEALKGSEGKARDKAWRVDGSVKVDAVKPEGEGEDLHPKAAAKQP
ncbi:hypothetical protein A1O3_02098, partial [Capronia epimyces CBS 606.96]